VPLVIAADLKMRPRRLYSRELALRALSDGGAVWAAKKVEEKAIESDTSLARERYAEERGEREVRNLAAETMVSKVVAETTDVRRPQALLMLSLLDDEEDMAMVDGLNLNQLLLRCYAFVLRERLSNAWQGYDDRLLDLAKRHGIDVKMVENAAKRELADQAAGNAKSVGLPVPESGMFNEGENDPDDPPTPTPESLAQPGESEIPF
jgi:hypothetical protein